MSTNRFEPRRPLRPRSGEEKPFVLLRGLLGIAYGDTRDEQTPPIFVVNLLISSPGLI
jgi:hypothetical protein